MKVVKVSLVSCALLVLQQVVTVSAVEFHDNEATDPKVVVGDSEQDTPEQAALWRKLSGGAIDNEGNYKILHTGVSSSRWITTERTRYYCTFRNLWTPQRHPKHYPADARWSPASIYSHTLNYQPWKVGQRVSMGIEDIVERGFVENFAEEVEVAGEQCLDYENSGGTGFYTSVEDHVHLPGLDVSYSFPYLSSIAGMSPSPDWFTGFYQYFVIDDYQQLYFDRFIIQTFPLDGGTDKAISYTAEHDFQDPPKSVARITWAESPNGAYVNPQKDDIWPVAEWDCQFHVGAEELVRPDCDYLKYPNCNNTACTDTAAAVAEDQPAAAPAECLEYDEILATTRSSKENVDGKFGANAAGKSAAVAIMSTMTTAMAVAVMTMLGFLML